MNLRPGFQKIQLKKYEVIENTAQVSSPSNLVILNTEETRPYSSLKGDLRECESFMVPMPNFPRIKPLARMINEEYSDLSYFEDGTKSKAEFQKLQISEISVAISSVVGIAISILSYDIEFEQGDDELLDNLLWISFWVGNLTIFLNVMRHLQKLRYLKSRNIFPKKATLTSTRRIWSLILEIVILLIQPYPWTHNIRIYSMNVVESIEFYYYVNDILSALVTFRLFVIIRVILNMTSYLSPRAGRVTSFCGSEADYKYAIKSLMKKCPLSVVIFTFLTSVVIFGHILRICERPLSRTEAPVMRLSDFWNAMWCVILTMTTVGYGDFYAKTHFGRLVSFVCCLWGVFICSLLVVSLTNVLQMEAPEEKSFFILDKLQLRNKLRNQAAKIITNLIKVSVNTKKQNNRNAKQGTLKRNQELISKIRTDLKDFRLISRKIKMVGGNHDFNDYMMIEMNNIKKEMKETQQRQEMQFKQMIDIYKQTVEMFQLKMAEKCFDRVPDQERSNISIIPVLK